MPQNEAAGEVSIRRIKGNEINQVVKLTIDSFSKEISITGLDSKRLWSLARIYRLASHFYPLLDMVGVHIETFLVAATNGTIAGEIHLVPHGKGVWSLDSSAVDPRFRGRGIYRNLLKQSLEYISQRQGKIVITSLWTSNIAPVKVTNELKFEVIEEKTLMHLEDINMKPIETKGKIYVRTAESTDAKKIQEFRNKVYQKQSDEFKAAMENHSESFPQRLRNRIAKIGSKEWVLEQDGNTIGYAKCVYTSTEEAASIEFFHVLPSDKSGDHASILLHEILAFLKLRGFTKVMVSINSEREDVKKSFETFGFKSLTSLYEMVKMLPSG